jgi:hypothetical protein
LLEKLKLLEKLVQNLQINKLSKFKCSVVWSLFYIILNRLLLIDKPPKYSANKILEVKF